MTRNRPGPPRDRVNHGIGRPPGRQGSRLCVSVWQMWLRQPVSHHEPGSCDGARWQMCLHHPELLRHVAQTRSATMIATAAGSHGLEDRQSPCRGSSHFAVRQRRLPQIVRSRQAGTDGGPPRVTAQRPRDDADCIVPWSRSDRRRLTEDDLPLTVPMLPAETPQAGMKFCTCPGSRPPSHQSHPVSWFGDAQDVDLGGGTRLDGAIHGNQTRLAANLAVCSMSDEVIGQQLDHGLLTASWVGVDETALQICQGTDEGTGGIQLKKAVLEGLDGRDITGENRGDVTR